MYSRYIPPPKETAPKAPDTALPKPTPGFIAPPPAPRQGAYDRYIPPPKPAPKHHFHFSEETAPDQPTAKRAKLTVEETPEVPEVASPSIKDSLVDSVNKVEKAEKKSKKKKAKKDKETKASAKQDKAAVEDPVVEAPVVEAPIVEAPVVEDPVVESSKDEPVDIPAEAKDLAEVPKLKEKKKKKKSKEEPKQDDKDVPAEEDDEIRKRHKSVFLKKQKSMTAPEPAPSTSDLPNGTENQDVPMEDAPQETVVYGLEPLPQPAPVIADTSKPDYETLPPWLAEPIRVSRKATAPFTDLGVTPDTGITPELADRLKAKGYKEAFAIQTAVIPQLLPHHCRTMHSDILVSAATGSGKTLAYALPMIRDLSQGNRHLTKLRTLIVLPTRELVRQAQQICDECAGVFALDGKKRRVKVGIAMGSQAIQKEQAALVERGERYDPEAYKQRQKRLSTPRWDNHNEDDGEEYDTEDEEKAEIRRREDQVATLPDHVLDYKSKVDILICTPGRLVEHIKYTPGFSLEYVRWLIVDEADKLLGQNFQQWLDVVMPKIHSNEKMNARNHKQSNISGVRKVILSATMTRDLDLLDGLKLRRPKLVVLEGSGAGEDMNVDSAEAEHALPEYLQETALKADANLKPLFLLDLLQSSRLKGTDNATKELSDDTSSSSDSDSDSDSDSSSEASRRTTTSRMPSILIFTKSNETAIRLSRLLSLLSPPLESTLGTLTSTTAYSTRKQTLRAFSAGKLRIIVASDLISRGIDLPNLEHVINYDMPSSVASYVHRVGRTARAGKSGHAWTLFTDAEARWFWKEVASEHVIRRSGKVERIRVTEEKEEAFEDKKARYEVALEALGREAGERRRGH